ncbi:MAG TPA: hypothetical protein DCS76_02290 [Gemmatimonadetes bacterium]|nr:hypothetical protein [Gemmatimonadota bacterium]
MKLRPEIVASHGNAGHIFRVAPEEIGRGMKMRLCGTTMGFTPEEQNQILQDNALKVYGFQPSVRR